MQIAYMPKEAAITVRLPESLKRRLTARAKTQRRSLSAQVVQDLQSVVGESGEEGVGGEFLGMFRGSRVPTDHDIAEVRALLWGRLRNGRVRRG
jgi:hypothetical protein